jgi:hypothetical protein
MLCDSDMDISTKMYLRPGISNTFKEEDLHQKGRYNGPPSNLRPGLTYQKNYRWCTEI